MVTVLIHEWVTGGGLAGSSLPRTWAAEGAAMRRALAREFASVPGTRVVVTLDDRLPADEGPWTIIRIGPGAEPDTFATLAGRADYTLTIAPESGGILAERARILERTASRSLGSTAQAVSLTGDKLRLGAFLAERGIATPPPRLVCPASGLPRDHPYPAVLKPIDGAGSIDTFLIRSAAELPAEARAWESSLLQPFVPGIALSASFLAGGQGLPRLIGVGRQRVIVRDGRFSYQGGTLPAPGGWLTTDVIAAVAAIPGLGGFVGVDFVYDEATGKASVIEINPRPTTSVVGLLRLLPPGCLAQSWLEGTGELAAWVHAQAPVTFFADGTFGDEKGPPSV